MEKKICIVCNILKPIDEFSVYNKKKSLRLNQCKTCKKLYLKKYNSENIDKTKVKRKEYREKNKEFISELKKRYYSENKDKIRIYKRKWESDKRKKDILFTLKQHVRHRISEFLKTKKMSKFNKTFDMVGCTPEFLKIYLEQQFKNGMCWENRSQWHIDHIIPLSTAETKEELIKLCHYTNLQPLWAGENLSKGSKVITDLK